MRNNEPRYDPNDFDQQVAEAVSRTLQKAHIDFIAQTGNRSKARAMQMVSTGCVAAIQALALICGGCSDCDETGHHNDRNPTPDQMVEVGRRHMNPTSLLFAAILVNKICPEGPDANGAVACEISPTVIADALDTTERLIGKRPDEFLDPNMCKQVRECIEEGGVPLAKLLESRKASPSKTLN
jgi:hypothetical protein